ncbi:hypothetical protein [Saccharothrix variisporea]|uniref:Beta-lactamase family protein n=1 Tax=Saccharothrix variisporea TaxID=543527 RepID=A0A495XAM8_9PSEU|nr:hypothetical protein [Saccharothrix variisporea]RKT69894.1 hypothetical protein DFJ66_3132 [Saccharothrix variisporea]
MPLTRRALLTAAGCTLLWPGTAGALPPDALPPGATDWLAWLRGNRQQVAVVVDDGRGGRLAHRPHEPQPLASLAHLTHLDAYARAVETGRVAPTDRVRTGEWERHLLPLDRGAHAAALRHLGITSTNGVTADDPHATVTWDDLAAVLTRFADNAAADCLRTHLDPSLPSPLGEGLRLVLGRHADPDQYLIDPQLRLEVLGRYPGVAPDRAWARGTWHGTAAEVHRLLRTPSAAAGTRLGTLPGVVTAAVRVRWDDGRVGTGVALAREVPEGLFADAMGLSTMLRSVLYDPAALREFHVGLT